MMSRIRMTVHTYVVLAEFLANPRGELYGGDITDRTGVVSGTVYPILARLASAGWLAMRTETGDAAQLGRPLRRYYRLTDEGVHAAQVDATTRDLKGHAMTGATHRIISAASIHVTDDLLVLDGFTRLFQVDSPDTLRALGLVLAATGYHREALTAEQASAGSLAQDT